MKRNEKENMKGGPYFVEGMVEEYPFKHTLNNCQNTPTNQVLVHALRLVELIIKGGDNVANDMNKMSYSTFEHVTF